jgi:predicted nucleotidyltransferase
MARITLDPAVVADLCSRYAIQEISLFGSVTRDDFRPDSDVDILVEFAPGAQIGLFDLIQIKEELSSSIGREVDLVTMGMLSPFFRGDVLAQREVIYVSPQ